MPSRDHRLRAAGSCGGEGTGARAGAARPPGGRRLQHKRGERGQATVELVAVMPLAVVVVLAAAGVLAAGAASEAAGAAAEAGAAAILQERDPRAAARQALGDSGSSRATIRVAGRRVRVTVRPDTPVLAPFEGWLTATETADAGPGPAAQPSLTVVRGGDGEGSRPREEGDRR